MDDLKLITVVIVTFLIAFATSFLLDVLLFNQNPVKYILVVLLILVELYFGVLIYLSLTTQKPK
jgi:hypothetical protein